MMVLGPLILGHILYGGFDESQMWSSRRVRRNIPQVKYPGFGSLYCVDLLALRLDIEYEAIKTYLGQFLEYA